MADNEYTQVINIDVNFDQANKHLDEFESNFDSSISGMEEKTNGLGSSFVDEIASIRKEMSTLRQDLEYARTTGREKDKFASTKNNPIYTGRQFFPERNVSGKITGMGGEATDKTINARIEMLGARLKYFDRLIPQIEKELSSIVESNIKPEAITNVTNAVKRKLATLTSGKDKEQDFNVMMDAVLNEITVKQAATKSGIDKAQLRTMASATIKAYKKSIEDSTVREEMKVIENRYAPKAKYGNIADSVSDSIISQYVKASLERGSAIPKSQQKLQFTPKGTAAEGSTGEHQASKYLGTASYKFIANLASNNPSFAKALNGLRTADGKQLVTTDKHGNMVMSGGITSGQFFNAISQKLFSEFNTIAPGILQKTSNIYDLKDIDTQNKIMNRANSGSAGEIIAAAKQMEILRQRVYDETNLYAALDEENRYGLKSIQKITQGGSPVDKSTKYSSTGMILVDAKRTKNDAYRIEKLQSADEKSPIMMFSSGRTRQIGRLISENGEGLENYSDISNIVRVASLGGISTKRDLAKKEKIANDPNFKNVGFHTFDTDTRQIANEVYEEGNRAFAPYFEKKFGKKAGTFDYWWMADKDENGRPTLEGIKGISPEEYDKLSLEDRKAYAPTKDKSRYVKTVVLEKAAKQGNYANLGFTPGVEINSSANISKNQYDELSDEDKKRYRLSDVNYKSQRYVLTDEALGGKFVVVDMPELINNGESWLDTNLMNAESASKGFQGRGMFNYKGSVLGISNMRQRLKDMGITKLKVKTDMAQKDGEGEYISLDDLGEISGLFSSSTLKGDLFNAKGLEEISSQLKSAWVEDPMYSVRDYSEDKEKDSLGVQSTMFLRDNVIKSIRSAKRYIENINAIKTQSGFANLIGSKNASIPSIDGVYNMSSPEVIRAQREYIEDTRRKMNAGEYVADESETIDQGRLVKSAYTAILEANKLEAENGNENAKANYEAMIGKAAAFFKETKSTQDLNAWGLLDDNGEIKQDVLYDLLSGTKDYKGRNIIFDWDNPDQLYSTIVRAPGERDEQVMGINAAGFVKNFYKQIMGVAPTGIQMNAKSLEKAAGADFDGDFVKTVFSKLGNAKTVIAALQQAMPDEFASGDTETNRRKIADAFIDETFAETYGAKLKEYDNETWGSIVDAAAEITAAATEAFNAKKRKDAIVDAGNLIKSLDVAFEGDYLGDTKHAIQQDALNIKARMLMGLASMRGMNTAGIKDEDIISDKLYKAQRYANLIYDAGTTGQKKPVDISEEGWAIIRDLGKFGKNRGTSQRILNQDSRVKVDRSTGEYYISNGTDNSNIRVNPNDVLEFEDGSMYYIPTLRGRQNDYNAEAGIDLGDNIKSALGAGSLYTFSATDMNAFRNNLLAYSELSGDIDRKSLYKKYLKIYETAMESNISENSEDNPFSYMFKDIAKTKTYNEITKEFEDKRNARMEELGIFKKDETLDAKKKQEFFKSDEYKAMLKEKSDALKANGLEGFIPNEGGKAAALFGVTSPLAKLIKAYQKVMASTDAGLRFGISDEDVEILDNLVAQTETDVEDRLKKIDDNTLTNIFGGMSEEDRAKYNTRDKQLAYLKKQLVGSGTTTGAVKSWLGLQTIDGTPVGIGSTIREQYEMMVKQLAEGSLSKDDFKKMETNLALSLSDPINSLKEFSDVQSRSSGAYALYQKFRKQQYGFGKGAVGSLGSFDRKHLNEIFDIDNLIDNSDFVKPAIDKIVHQFMISKKGNTIDKETFGRNLKNNLGITDGATLDSIAKIFSGEKFNQEDVDRLSQTAIAKRFDSDIDLTDEEAMFADAITSDLSKSGAALRTIREQLKEKEEKLVSLNEERDKALAEGNQARVDELDIEIKAAEASKKKFETSASSAVQANPKDVFSQVEKATKLKELTESLDRYISSDMGLVGKTPEEMSRFRNLFQNQDATINYVKQYLEENKALSSTATYRETKNRYDRLTERYTFGPGGVKSERGKSLVDKARDAWVESIYNKAGLSPEEYMYGTNILNSYEKQRNQYKTLESDVKTTPVKVLEAELENLLKDETIRGEYDDEFKSNLGDFNKLVELLNKIKGNDRIKNNKQKTDDIEVAIERAMNANDRLTQDGGAVVENIQRDAKLVDQEFIANLLGTAEDLNNQIARDAKSGSGIESINATIKKYKSQAYGIKNTITKIVENPNDYDFDTDTINRLREMLDNEDSVLNQALKEVDELKNKKIDRFIDAKKRQITSINRRVAKGYVNSFEEKDNIQQTIEDSISDINRQINQATNESVKKNLEETKKDYESQLDKIKNAKVKDNSNYYNAKLFSLEQDRISNKARLFGVQNPLDETKRYLEQELENRRQEKAILENERAEYVRRQEGLDTNSQEYKGHQEKINAIDKQINLNDDAIDEITNKFSGFGLIGEAAFNKVGKAAIKFTSIIRQKFLNEAKRFLVEFEQSMKNIQAITLKTDEEMETVKTNAVSQAINLKTSVKNVTAVQEALYRQGLSDNEVKRNTESVIKYSTVTGTDVTKSLKNLTTAVQSGLVENVNKAMDVLVALGDTVATTADEIAKGMQKTAAAAKNAGVKYEELATILAVGTSTTQLGGTQIGRALNTMMSRYRKVTTSGMTDAAGGMQSINDVEAALSIAGISIRKDAETFNSFTDILVAISEKWDSLSDINKSNIAYSIAGTTQSNVFQSIMEGMANGVNGKSFAELLETAMESEGITEDKYAITTDTISASLERLKSATDSVIESFSWVSDIIKFFIDTLSEGIASLGNNDFSSIVSGAVVTLLPTILGALLIPGLKEVAVIVGGIAAAALVVASVVSALNVDQAAIDNKKRYSADVELNNKITEINKNRTEEANEILKYSKDENQRLSETLSSEDIAKLKTLFPELASSVNLATLSVKEFKEAIDKATKANEDSAKLLTLDSMRNVDVSSSAFDSYKGITTSTETYYSKLARYLLSTGFSSKQKYNVIKGLENGTWDKYSGKDKQELDKAIEKFNLGYSSGQSYERDVLIKSNEAKKNSNINNIVSTYSDWFDLLGLSDVQSFIVDSISKELGSSAYEMSSEDLQEAVTEYIDNNIITPLETMTATIGYEAAKLLLVEQYSEQIYSDGVDTYSTSDIDEIKAIKQARFDLSKRQEILESRKAGLEELKQGVLKNIEAASELYAATDISAAEYDTAKTNVSNKSAMYSDSRNTVIRLTKAQEKIDAIEEQKKSLYPNYDSFIEWYDNGNNMHNVLGAATYYKELNSKRKEYEEKYGWDSRDVSGNALRGERFLQDRVDKNNERKSQLESDIEYYTGQANEYYKSAYELLSNEFSDYITGDLLNKDGSFNTEAIDNQINYILYDKSFVQDVASKGSMSDAMKNSILYLKDLKESSATIFEALDNAISEYESVVEDGLLYSEELSDYQDISSLVIKNIVPLTKDLPVEITNMIRDGASFGEVVSYVNKQIETINSLDKQMSEIAAGVSDLFISESASMTSSIDFMSRVNFHAGKNLDKAKKELDKAAVQVEQATHISQTNEARNSLANQYYEELKTLINSSDGYSTSALENWLSSLEEIQENGHAVIEYIDSGVIDSVKSFIEYMNETASQLNVETERINAGVNGRLFNTVTGEWVNASAQSYLTNTSGAFNFTEAKNKRDFVNLIKQYDNYDALFKVLNDETNGYLDKFSSYLSTETFSDAIAAMQSGAGSYQDLIDAMVEFASSALESTVFASEFINGVIDTIDNGKLFDKIASGDYTKAELKAFETATGIDTRYFDAATIQNLGQYYQEENNKTRDDQANEIISQLYANLTSLVEGSLGEGSMDLFNKDTSIEDILLKAAEAGADSKQISNIQLIVSVLRQLGYSVSGVNKKYDTRYNVEEGTFAGYNINRIEENGDVVVVGNTLTDDKFVYTNAKDKTQWQKISGTDKYAKLGSTLITQEEYDNLDEETKKAYSKIKDSNNTFVGYGKDIVTITQEELDTALKDGSFYQEVGEIIVGNIYSGIYGAATKTISDVYVPKTDLYDATNDERFATLNSMVTTRRGYNKVEKAIAEWEATGKITSDNKELIADYLGIDPALLAVENARRQINARGETITANETATFTDAKEILIAGSNAEKALGKAVVAEYNVIDLAYNIVDGFVEADDATIQFAQALIDANSGIKTADSTLKTLTNTATKLRESMSVDASKDNLVDFIKDVDFTDFDNLISQIVNDDVFGEMWGSVLSGSEEALTVVAALGDGLINATEAAQRLQEIFREGFVSNRTNEELDALASSVIGTMDLSKGGAYWKANQLTLSDNLYNLSKSDPTGYAQLIERDPALKALMSASSEAEWKAAYAEYEAGNKLREFELARGNGANEAMSGWTTNASGYYSAVKNGRMIDANNYLTSMGEDYSEYIYNKRLWDKYNSEKELTPDEISSVENYFGAKLDTEEMTEQIRLFGEEYASLFNLLAEFIGQDAINVISKLGVEKANDKLNVNGISMAQQGKYEDAVQTAIDAFYNGGMTEDWMRNSYLLNNSEFANIMNDKTLSDQERRDAVYALTTSGKQYSLGNRETEANADTLFGYIKENNFEQARKYLKEHPGLADVFSKKYGSSLLEYIKPEASTEGFDVALQESNKSGALYTAKYMYDTGAINSDAYNAIQELWGLGTNEEDINTFFEKKAAEYKDSAFSVNKRGFELNEIENKINSDYAAVSEEALKEYLGGDYTGVKETDLALAQERIKNERADLGRTTNGAIAFWNQLDDTQKAKMGLTDEEFAAMYNIDPSMFKTSYETATTMSSLDSRAPIYQQQFLSALQSTSNIEELDALMNANPELKQFVESNSELSSIVANIRSGLTTTTKAAADYAKTLGKDAKSTDAFRKSSSQMLETISNARYMLDKKSYNKSKGSDDMQQLTSIFGLSEETIKDMDDSEIRSRLQSYYDGLVQEYEELFNGFSQQIYSIKQFGSTDENGNLIYTLNGVTIKAGEVKTVGIDEAIAMVSAMGDEAILAELETLKAKHGSITLTATENGDGTMTVQYGDITFTAGSGKSSKSSSGGGGSEDKVAKKWKNKLSVSKHLINMIQAKENRLQSAGKLTDYGNVLSQENKYQQAYIKDLQNAIKEEKKHMASLKTNSDEWISARDQVTSWEEEIESATSAMEENTRKLKENQEAIRQTRITLEQTVREQIEARKQIEEDMLSGRTSLEDTVLEAIKQRYQDESDLRIKNYNEMKEELEKEKELLEERFNARKENTDRIQKEEELAELKRQYASISLDSTRSRERLELAQKIADMEREINEQNDQEMLEARTEAIDEQIAAYDDMIEVEQSDLEDFLSDANNMAEELNNILEMSQEDLLTWLEDNVNEFSNLTKAAQEQMINSWTDTYEQYKHIINMWNDEIDNILSSKNRFLEYMKQADDYVNGDEETRASLLYQWGEQYDAFVNAYQNNNESFSHTDSWSGSSGSSSSSSTAANTKATTDNTTAIKAQTIATTNVNATIKDVASNLLSGFTAVGSGIIEGVKSFFSGTTVKKYASGGLVDYTGLAWLDGSASKPEYVLNSEQWQQLIGFKYHGYSVDTSGYGTTSNTVSVGDIVINAAHIDDDADVEELANRIGEIFSDKINESGFSTSRFCYR